MITKDGKKATRNGYHFDRYEADLQFDTEINKLIFVNNLSRKIKETGLNMGIYFDTKKGEIVFVDFKHKSAFSRPFYQFVSGEASYKHAYEEVDYGNYQINKDFFDQERGLEKNKRTDSEQEIMDKLPEKGEFYTSYLAGRKGKNVYDIDFSKIDLGIERDDEKSTKKKKNKNEEPKDILVEETLSKILTGTNLKQATEDFRGVNNKVLIDFSSLMDANILFLRKKVYLKDLQFSTKNRARGDQILKIKNTEVYKRMTDYTNGKPYNSFVVLDRIAKILNVKLYAYYPEVNNKQFNTNLSYEEELRYYPKLQIIDTKTKEIIYDGDSIKKVVQIMFDKFAKYMQYQKNKDDLFYKNVTRYVNFNVNKTAKFAFEMETIPDDLKILTKYIELRADEDFIGSEKEKLMDDYKTIYKACCKICERVDDFVYSRAELIENETFKEQTTESDIKYNKEKNKFENDKQNRLDKAKRQIRNYEQVNQIIRAVKDETNVYDEVFYDLFKRSFFYKKESDRVEGNQNYNGLINEYTLDKIDANAAELLQKAINTKDSHLYNMVDTKERKNKKGKKEKPDKYQINYVKIIKNEVEKIIKENKIWLAQEEEEKLADNGQISIMDMGVKVEEKEIDY